MRYKISGLVLFLVSVLVLSLSIVSAEILLGQPNSVYNLGDNLNIEVNIKPSQYTSTFFDMNLKCGESRVNIHKEHLSLDAGQKKQISSSLTLAKSFLGNMTGNCNIEANFGEEAEESQSFVISNKIQVALIVENMSINAGDEIILKGTALKENGGKVNGFVEISVKEIGVRITKEVSEGNFEVSLAFPENSRAGNYVLYAKVYEEYQGEETNFGETTSSLNIKKKPSKLEIALSKQNVLPGEQLVFSPIIYDQANERVGGEISVKIYDPFDKIFFQEILKSGEEKEIVLDTDSVPGYWKIEASSLGLDTKRLFYLDELEKAGFSIENDTLIIKNIGNVVYKKAVQISIGEVTEIKNMNLDVGQSKKLRLLAPEGSYNIRITDGAEEIVKEGVSLTGRVVSVSELGGGLSFIKRFPVVWLFLIAVFGLFILILVQRVVKKKYYAYTPTPSTIREKKEKGKEAKSKIVFPVPSLALPERAEHSLVLNGQKQNTGIVSVKLKELDKLKRTSSATINNIIKTITENKGAVYETSDYLMGIFTPAMTRTFANEIIAVRTGKEIQRILSEHNRKFKQKIDYGISLNSGDLVVKRDSDKLRFTSIGSTINLARKIAEMANQELLLSEDIHKRVLSEVKADKEIRQGTNVYHITRINERDKHSAFIQDFLERNKEGE